MTGWLETTSVSFLPRGWHWWSLLFQNPGSDMADEVPYDQDHPFTRVHNEVIFDRRLKPNDARLLNYVLAKPDGWQCKEDVVDREIGMGRKAYYASVRRLIALGYCIRTKGYDHSRKMVMWHQQWFRTPRAVPTSNSEKADRLPLMVSRESLEQVEKEGEEGALRAASLLENLGPNPVVDQESVVDKTDHCRDSPQWSVGQLLQNDWVKPAVDELLQTDAEAKIMSRFDPTTSTQC